MKAYASKPQLSDDQIREQVRYCGNQGLAMVIEFTQDPGPGNHYWDRWGVPLLDPEDPDTVLFEIIECRKSFPDQYIRIIACESGRGQALIRHSFMVHRPGDPTS